MSVVRDLILQADDQLRYPSGGELRSMVEYLSRGAERLAVVRVLTDNEKKIVDESAKQLFQRNPDYVAPGGNAYGQKQRAQCLRDYSWYLRLVTYGVLAGSTEMIQQIGLVGAREMYNSLGVPMPGSAEHRPGFPCGPLLRLPDPGNADQHLIQIIQPAPIPRGAPVSSGSFYWTINAFQPGRK
jgi:allophycocyanin-B